MLKAEGWGDIFLKETKMVKSTLENSQTIPEVKWNGKHQVLPKEYNQWPSIEEADSSA